MKRIARVVLGVSLAVGMLASVAVSVALAGPVSVKPGNAAPTQFPQALQCVCHGLLLSDWQASMHSKALEDPLFKAKVDEVEKAAGPAFGKFCRRCHAPVANMTSQDGAAEMSPAASQGVVCSFCHQVLGMSKPTANVPHRLALTGVMRAQLKDAQAPHFWKYSALHETSKNLWRLPQRRPSGERHAPRDHLHRVAEEPAGQEGSPVPGLSHERVATKGGSFDWLCEPRPLRNVTTSTG